MFGSVEFRHKKHRKVVSRFFGVIYDDLQTQTKGEQDGDFWQNGRIRNSIAAMGVTLQRFRWSASVVGPNGFTP